MWGVLATGKIPIASACALKLWPVEQPEEKAAIWFPERALSLHQLPNEISAFRPFLMRVSML